jgi:hypothetical protein
LEFVSCPFTRSRIRAVQIDAGNRHLSVSEPFLLAFAGTKLIQGFGSFREVHVPETVKIIGDSAFSHCESLVAIWIPPSVEVLAARCFSDCLRLARIVFGAGSRLGVIERDVFANCKSLSAFDIPASLERIDGSAFQSTKVSTITVDADNRHFSFASPFLLDFEGVSIIRYFGSAAEVQIPKRIQRLSRSCFQSCGSVRRVVFEEDAELLVIEESAFHGWGIESIAIPAAVVSLETKCFAHCGGLKVVSFESGSRLRDIGCDIFDESPNVERIEVPGTILEVCKGAFRDALKRGIVTIKM